MFTGNKENTADSRNNQPAQKSPKEKTMATSPANNMANIDLTKPLALEEQAWVKQRIQDLHGGTKSVYESYDTLEHYYPGKYSENNFVEIDAAKNGYISSYVGNCISNPEEGIVANLGKDVYYVQKHLNRLGILSDKDYAKEKPKTGKEISKTTIPITIEAIGYFQERVLHKEKGQIDKEVWPGYGTIKSLATITVAESRTKQFEFIKKQAREKINKTIKELGEAQKAEIERIKNEPATSENVQKLYEQADDAEEFGRLLKDYAIYNPDFALKAFDLMDFGEPDNLTRAIMLRLTDAEIEQLPQALDTKFYEALDAGWTSDKEYELMKKLKKGRGKNRHEVEKELIKKIERPIYDDIKKVYGEPGDVESLISIKCPFPLYYFGSPVSSFRINKKVARSLEGALNAVLAEYGFKKLKELRIGDNYGGTFNDRKMAGGTKKSTHAWGVAIDLNINENKLSWGADKALFAKPEYKKFLDIMENYGWYNLGRYKNYDYMHFQAVKI